MSGDVHVIRTPDGRVRYWGPASLAMTCATTQPDLSKLKPGIEAYALDVQSLDAPDWIPVGGTRAFDDIVDCGVTTTVATCTMFRERALS